MKYFLFAFLAFYSSAFAMEKTEPSKNIYNIGVNDIDGREIKLARYRGKVLLIVNTASECGFTPQYKSLQKLYEQHKAKGLIVLGFPSNDFGGQEPGTEKEIKRFCEVHYGISFPMFSKVKIKGDDKSELYKYLQETQPNAETRQKVKWNFNKFLVSRKGEVAFYFDSKIAPNSPEMQVAVEGLLRE